jgi:hypothetical protein
MLRFKDFSACVFVDGVEVEYFEAKTKWDDSEEGQEVMHAYIVGEPGKVCHTIPKQRAPCLTHFLRLSLCHGKTIAVPKPHPDIYS